MKVHSGSYRGNMTFGVQAC